MTLAGLSATGSPMTKEKPSLLFKYSYSKWHQTNTLLCLDVSVSKCEWLILKKYKWYTSALTKWCLFEAQNQNFHFWHHKQHIKGFNLHNSLKVTLSTVKPDSGVFFSPVGINDLQLSYLCVYSKLIDDNQCGKWGRLFDFIN